MARWSHWVWLALGIWLGLSNQGATAQGLPGPQVLPPPAAPVIYQPIPAAGPVDGNSVMDLPGMDLPETYAVMEGERERGPVRNLLYKVTHPFCWTTHNQFGCSSLHSEGTFIFGSCRAFFGQPCLKGPPPPDGTAPACGCGFP